MNHAQGRHGGGERRCYKCGQEGHIARQCRASDRICFQCGGVGHTRRDCPAHPSGQISHVERAKKEGARGGAGGGGERPCEGLSSCRDKSQTVQQECTQPEISTGPPPRPSLRTKEETPPGEGSTAEIQPIATTKGNTPSSTSPHSHPTQTPSEITSPKPKWPSQPEKIHSRPRSREGYGQSAHTCFHCNTPGHIKRNCPLLTRNKLDHTRDECQQAVRDGKDPVKSQERNPHHTPLLDSHCHLEYVFERYRHRGSFQAFMRENHFPGAFEGCITTFCDPAAFSASLGLWKDLLSESNVWGTFGIHPHNAQYYSPRLEEDLLQSLEHPKCVAFGEIGLDYSSHSASDPDTQKRVLRHQLSLAVSYGKPIILHCRDAEDDLLPILTSKVPSDWKIHLHCYTGPVDTATEFLTAFPNLFIGVTGNVTFAGARNVRDVVCSVPLERLLLETDAPYCRPGNLPRSMSSQYSHPGMVLHVGREVARVRGVGLREVLEASRRNVTTVYGI